MYNGNMKNKLPRKYRITCRVGKTECTHHNGVRKPENIVSSRYVDRQNGFADDSRRVRRSDAPENLVSLRYVGMHNGAAGDTKMAETLVLSGFSGWGGALSKPRAAFAHTVCSYTWEPAKDERAPLRHPAAVSWRTKKSRCLAGSQTKKRHKLVQTCVFAMQKK